MHMPASWRAPDAGKRFLHMGILAGLRAVVRVGQDHQGRVYG
jgi:hypothetical protein